MGFYGNISSVNKSTFQFDKIYPNRKEMDDACEADGIFIGRYVLVDYNEDSILGYVHAQITDDNLKDKPVVVGYQEKRYNSDTGEYEILSDRFYSGIPEVSEDGSEIKKDRLYEIGEYTGGIKIMPDTLVLCLGYIKTKCVVTTDDNQETPDIISWFVEGIENDNYNPQIFVARGAPDNSFVWLVDIDDIWDYNKGRFFINHQIDAQFYGQNIGRGWDSTVWQKTYKNGQVEYVMIAELNSVVPTFDVAVNAPTPIPQKPYYDADSSNVYYRLHLQPSWGLRIKAAEDRIYSNDESFPSDEKGKYYISNNAAPQDKDLAIYWFNKGFHKYIEEKPEITQDFIKLTPTGKSGNTYYDETDIFGKTAVDTYELSMMLPSIGQLVSKMWNIVYGEGTYKDILGNHLWNKAALSFNSGEDSDLIAAHEPEDENDTVDIKIRNTNLEWNTHNGIRAYWKYGAEENPELTYNKIAYNTLAGTINSVHDLIGMIIIEDDNLLQKNAANFDPSNIYYDKTTKKYYRKGKKYNFNADNIVGILGENMFDPRDVSNPYYRLESYSYDNYDDVHEINKESNNPVYEQIINNYYRVKQNDEIFENEVYGTIATTPINNFNIVNFDSSAIDPEDYLWWYNDVNGGEYVHETQNTPRNKPYYKLSVAEVVDKPIFYSPGMYYLMKQEFETIEERQAWDNTNVRNNINFSYFGIMNESNLAESLSLNGIDLTDENRLIGYKILKGVTVDPTRSDYVLIDINRRTDEESPADDENIVEISDGIFAYRWNGFEATLQSKDDILKTIEVDGESIEVLYYQYDITVFKSIGHSSLGSKTLKEWRDYIITQGLNEEDFKDLVRDESFIRRITDPFYTLANAVDIKNSIDDVDSNGYINYYCLKGEQDSDSAHDNQRYYWRISNPNSVQAQSLSWYELTPTLIPVYYDLNGEYYIKNDTDDYLRETASLLFLEDSDNQNLEYYQVSFIPETKTLFVPNLYYYLDNGKYKLANTLDESKTYYRYIDKYVAEEDPNGVYNIGARWNAEVDPRINIENNNDNIVVKGKTFEWEFQEIPDFAKDMNTIHGLILKINQMLLAGDKITRDNSTVQGCINLINDILDKFDQLKPAEIIMVDKLGRIHSADKESIQEVSAINYGIADGNTDSGFAAGEITTIIDKESEGKNEDDERWIKLTLTDGDSPDYKPHIKLEHTLNHIATNTETISDKNQHDDDQADPIIEFTGLNKNNNNDSNKDELQLYTPIIDNMGHVIGKNTETVTLPYGFKSISTDANVSLVANNTQDDIALIGDDWIIPTATNESVAGGVQRGLAFAHGSAQSVSARDVSNVFPAFGASFTIEDWKFDEKGHEYHEVDSNNNESIIETHTITIPRPTVVNQSGNTGNLLIGLSVDSVNIEDENHTIIRQESNGIFTTTKAYVGDLQLTGYSAAETNPLIVANDTINEAIKKLENVLDNSSTSVNTRISNEIIAFKGLVNDSEPTSTVYGIVNKAKSDLLGSIDDNIVDNEGTWYALKNYIDIQLSQVSVSDNYWGKQFALAEQAIITSAISSGANYTASQAVQLALTDVIDSTNPTLTNIQSYGIPAYVLTNDGGIKILIEGTYRVHGSMVLSLLPDSVGKVWLVKDHGGTLSQISGTGESTGATGKSDNGDYTVNTFIPLSDILVHLEENDVVYLYTGVTKVQGNDCKAIRHSSSYVLLELMESIVPQQNTEPEEPENNEGGE